MGTVPRFLCSLQIIVVLATCHLFLCRISKMSLLCAGRFSFYNWILLCSLSGLNPNLPASPSESWDYKRAAIPDWVGFLPYVRDFLFPPEHTRALWCFVLGVLEFVFLFCGVFFVFVSRLQSRVSSPGNIVLWIFPLISHFKKVFFNYNPQYFFSLAHWFLFCLLGHL